MLITARTSESVARAKRDIVGESVSLRTGAHYDAVIKSKRDYGVFVRIGDHEGLVHQSELKHENGSENYAVGHSIRVKVLGADEQGRIKLTEKHASA